MYFILLITDKQTNDMFSSSCWYRFTHNWHVYFILLITGNHTIISYTLGVWKQQLWWLTKNGVARESDHPFSRLLDWYDPWLYRQLLKESTEQCLWVSEASEKQISKARNWYMIDPQDKYHVLLWKVSMNLWIWIRE